MAQTIPTIESTYDGQQVSGWYYRKRLRQALKGANSVSVARISNNY